MRTSSLVRFMLSDHKLIGFLNPEYLSELPCVCTPGNMSLKLQTMQSFYTAELYFNSAGNFILPAGRKLKFEVTHSKPWFLTTEGEVIISAEMDYTLYFSIDVGLWEAEFGITPEGDTLYPEDEDACTIGFKMWDELNPNNVQYFNIGFYVENL